MSSAGLSRRRVGASASSPTSSSVQISNGGSSAASPAAAPQNGGSVHAGTAMEGGSKIAYDPRDLLESLGDAGKMPKLTLLEEILLLGLKDKQGYLSFWNDNISYALRGCILLELALRRRIAMIKDSARRRYPLPDRLIEVIDERQTGETILDEALKMIKTSERMGVASWIDLLSGETWNVMKIGFQLKQVRERLAKGLVDKGILRTEKRNFLLFDMATHPVADGRTKEDLNNQVISLLTTRTSTIPPQALAKDTNVKYRNARAVSLVCSAYAASVLENPLQRLSYDAKGNAISRCDDILAEFSSWPFGGSGGGSRRKREGMAAVARGSGESDKVQELVREVKKEMEDPEDACFEILAAVFEVFGKMDSLI